MAIMSDVLK